MQCASRSSGRSSSQSTEVPLQNALVPKLLLLIPLEAPPPPMLIYNLQPPGQSPFPHTPLLNYGLRSNSWCGLLDERTRQRGKTPREQGSQLSLVVVPYLPSKKELSLEHLGTSENSVLVELLEN